MSQCHIRKHITLLLLKPQCTTPPLTHYGLFITPNMSIPTIIIVNQQQLIYTTIIPFQKLKTGHLVVNWQKLSEITIFMPALLDYACPYTAMNNIVSMDMQSWIIHELNCQGRVIGRGGNRLKLVQGISPQCHAFVEWHGGAGLPLDKHWLRKTFVSTYLSLTWFIYRPSSHTA